MNFLKLNKIFTGDYYAIPDYQRDYEWTSAQTSTLLDDIFSIMEAGSNKMHFFGAIVTIPFEEENAVNKTIDLNEYNISKQSVKHIVDGQQRLTTFSLLMKALVDLITDDVNLSTTNMASKKTALIQPLESMLYGRDFSTQISGLSAPQLLLNGKTGIAYNYLLALDHLKDKFTKPNKKLKGPKRLLKAYESFKEEIKDKCEKLVSANKYSENHDFYADLIMTLRNNLQFVEIDCGSSSDAFQVFDSLNGKGLDLTAADRIKNIFMNWSPANVRSSNWDEFEEILTDKNLTSFFVSLFFYTHKKRIPKNNIPDTFRDTYKNLALNNYNTFFNELCDKAKLFALLKNYSDTNNPISDESKDILIDFKDLRVEQVNVLLFAVLQTYGESIIKKKSFDIFLKALHTLIIRMQVCDKSMNRLDTQFSEYIKEMKENSVSLKIITKMIIKHGKIFVPDNQFEAAFKDLSTKDSKQNNIYLRHIELYLLHQSGNKHSIPRTLTIEHIIPQNTNYDTWYGKNTIPEDLKDSFKDLVVENIGNKLLLYRPDNSLASNNSYPKKLKLYKQDTKKSYTYGNSQDTFKLVDKLIQDYPKQFTHEEVKSRASQLAKYALKIWELK